MVETPTEVPRYLAALGVGSLLVCRLLVEPDVARTRLAARHADDPVRRRWHLDRTTELTRVLDQAWFDEVTVDASRRSPLDVAYEVAHHAEWLPDISSPR